MANIKFSQLSSVTANKDTDVLLVIQDGTNKKVDLSTFLNSLNSNTTIRINPNQKAINTVFSTSDNTNMLFIDGVNNSIGINTDSPDLSFKLNVAGNILCTGVISDSYEIVDSSLNLNTGKTTSLINASASYKDFILPAGYDGQIKNIVWNSVSDSITEVSITCNGLIGSDTTKKITLKSIGQGVTLQYSSSLVKWFCVGVNNHNGASPVVFSA